MCRADMLVYFKGLRGLEALSAFQAVFFRGTTSGPHKDAPSGMNNFHRENST